MKLWGSMRQQAAKVAFEADKAVRIKREESAIAGVKSRIDVQARELGKAVLSLYAEGEISHPQVAPFVEEVARLQEQIEQLESKLVGIRAEEHVEGAPVADATTAAPPPPVAEPAGVTCANCGATVAQGASCPECGQVLAQE